MTEEQILAKIDQLILDMQRGDVSLQDYGVQLAELQQQLSDVQYQKVTPEPRDDTYPQLGIQEMAEGTTPLIGLKAEQQMKTDFPMFQDLTPQEQEEAWQQSWDLSQRTIQDMIERGKYTTGEFDEPIKPEVGVSSIREAQKGMVFDPELGTQRKAGTGELLYESLFRQVKATPEQRVMFEQERQSERAQYAQSLLASGMSKDEAADELAKYDEMNEKLGYSIAESGFVVETPLAWGLRMLNTGSALAAEPYKYLQSEIIGLEEARGDSEPYIKAEDDVSQFATNVALNQGMYNAFMDYIPEDERNTLWVQAAGLGGELAIPVTPTYAVTTPLKATAKGLNVGGKLMGSAKLAKAGMVVEKPVRTMIGLNDDLLKLNAAVTEVENGLRAIEAPNPKAEALRIQDELAKKGTLSSITVREKGSKAIGDVYAGNNALHQAAENAKAYGDEFVFYDDLDVLESPYIQSVFNRAGSHAIPVQEIEAIVKQQDEILDGLRATRGGTEPSIARAYRVMQEARTVRPEDILGDAFDAERGSRAISADYNLLKPRMKSQAIFNMDARFLPDDIQDLLKQSAKRPLTADELQRLQAAVSDGRLKPALSSSLDSPRTRYFATRDTVGEVVQDNLLRNIPEDYIYISRDVAVPVERLQGKQGEVFKQQVKELLEGSFKYENGHIQQVFTPQAAKKLLRYLGAKGSLGRFPKLKRVLNLQAEGRVGSRFTEVLLPNEMKRLQEIVSAEVAKEVLGGVTLRTGAATAEIASIPTGVRQTLVPMGQGKRATRNIFAQGLRNARRIVGKRTYGFGKKAFGKEMETFQQPVVRRFNEELNRANNAALTQVNTKMEKAIAKAVTDGGDPQDGFNALLREMYLQEEGLYIGKTFDEEVDVERIVTRGTYTEETRAAFVEQRMPQGLQPDALLGDGFTQTKLKTMSGIYGDEAVDDYLRTLQITRDQAGNIDQAGLDKLYQHIEEMESTLRRQAMYPMERERWDFVLTRFFGNDRIQYLKDNELLEKLLAVNPDRPIFEANNLKELTIDEFKNVIELLRVEDPTLRGKGLFAGLPTMTEEAIMIPLLEYATGVQRRANMNLVLNDFINANEGFLQNIGRNSYGTFPTDTGTPMMARWGQSQEQLEFVARNSLDDLDINRLDPDELIKAVRERLYDGVERDLLVNQTRENKAVIAKRLLGRMVQEGTTEIDLKNFAIEMLGENGKGVITSRTVQNIRDRLESIYNVEIRRLEQLKDTTATSQYTFDESLRLTQELDQQGKSHPLVIQRVHQANVKTVTQARRLEQTRQGLLNQANDLKAKIRANDGDVTAEAQLRLLQPQLDSVTKEQQRLLDILEQKYEETLPKVQLDISKRRVKAAQDIHLMGKRAEQIDVLKSSRDLSKQIVDDFAQEYLLHITGGARGNTVAIFNDLKQQLDMYFDTYGMHYGSLSDYLVTSANRIDYLQAGNRIAIAYGDDIADNVKRIREMVSDSRFTSMIDELRAGENKASFQYAFNLFKSFLSGTRRWSIAHMLGGGFLPATRFFGMNRITAPHIFFTSVGMNNLADLKTGIKFVGVAMTGDLARLADLLPRAIGQGRKAEMWFDANRLLYAPADEVIISARTSDAARDYTAGELRALIDYHGIEFSRTNIEFYETEIKKMLSEVGLSIGGAKLPKYKKAWAKIDPKQSNIYAQYAQYQDAELRRLVFVETLKKGGRVEDAAELARRSMLDYNSLSKAEKETVSKYVYFYAFMRTMSSEMVNGMYRAWKGGTPMASFVPRLIKAQDQLNRRTAEDYYALSNQQLSRIYNIYHGSVDGIDLYMSGAVNPQMQMFELMSNTAIYGLAGVDALGELDIPKAARMAQDATLNAIADTLLKGSTSSPVGQWLLNTYDATYSKGFRPPSIPTELVTAAEMEGKLPELIKMYGLIEKPYISAGRPLSAEGKQYVFPDGKMYRKYLNHQILGLTTSMISTELGIGILGGSSTGARTRAIADLQKARQIGQPTGIEVPSPTGQGTIVIPTAQTYLKARVRQDEAQADWQTTLMTAYMTGFTTPTQSTPDSKKLEYNMRSLLKKLEDIQRKYEE